MAKKPRVVFDCNVLLLAAARQKSVAASCLALAEKGVVQLFVSEEVLLELEDVLNRPEVRAYFPDLSDEIAGAFLKRTDDCNEFRQRFRALKVIEPVDLLKEIDG